MSDEVTKIELNESQNEMLDVVLGHSKESFAKEKGVELEVVNPEEVKEPVAETPKEEVSEKEVKDDISKDEIPKGDTPKDEIPKEEVPDNPFLADFNKEEEKVEEIKPFEKVEDVYSLLATDLGVEIKDEKQLKEFTTNYKDIVDKSSKYDEVKNQLDLTAKDINSLSDEVYGLMQLDLQGKDVREEMIKLVSDSILPFDAKLDFEKQDIKTVMNHLYPDNGFDDDDFEDMDTAAMKQVIRGAKKDYEALQAKVNNPKKTNYREQETKQSKEQIQKFNQSIEGSVSDFGKKENNFKPEQIQSITKDMEGGMGYVLSLFMENDGTYKADAVEKLALLKHGKEALEYAKKFSKHRGETKATEEILKRETLIQKPVDETSTNEYLQMMNKKMKEAQKKSIF